MPRKKPVQPSAQRATRKPKPKPKPPAEVLPAGATNAERLDNARVIIDRAIETFDEVIEQSEKMLAPPVKQPSGYAKLKAAGRIAVMLSLTPEQHARFKAQAEAEYRKLAPWIVATCLRVLE